MKRHALCPGLNTLTLSLLSSLTLLTACGGGGGKDAPAAAIPQETKGSEPVVVVVPTAKDFSSVDEPYFVAESSVAPRGEDPIYRLNILDGRGPITETKLPLAATALANGTFESSTPFTGKWTVIQKFKRTLESVTEKQEKEIDGKKVFVDVEIGKQYKEQLLGSGTLVFIQKDGDANKLVEIDLSRNSALTPKPLSSITDACLVTGSHLIKRDGSEAAVFVTTAGADKKCGEPGSDDAKDNLVRIVKTGTTTAEERAKQYTPLIDTKQVVSHIYQDGVLTGVLAQRGAGATTQLEVLSPTLSEVLNTTPIKIGASAQYSTSADDAKLGVEWIAHEPLETGAGYLRLQQVDGRGDYVNAMYRFSWNATDKTASTSATPVLRLTGGAPSNKGVYDHRYVYFVDGDQVFYGPTSDPKQPFTDLTVLDELFDKTDTTRVQISHQTRDYLVVRAEGLGLDAAFAVPKDSALLSVKLFDNTNLPKEKQQTPIGLWQKVTTTKDGETRTPYLITKQRSSYDDSPYNANSYSIKRTSLANGQGAFDIELAEFLDGVNRINLLSPVWSPIAINGQRDLVTAIVCPRTTTSTKGDCSTPGDEIKTVDFDKKGFGLVLGKFLINPVKGSSIQTGDVYDGINAFANLTIINNRSTAYNDPVFFNTRLAVPDPTKITTRLPFVVTPKPAP